MRVCWLEEWGGEKKGGRGGDKIISEKYRDYSVGGKKCIIIYRRLGNFSSSASTRLRHANHRNRNRKTNPLGEGGPESILNSVFFLFLVFRFLVFLSFFSLRSPIRFKNRL